MAESSEAIGSGPFRSDRYFRVWRYSAITRSLLLRSVQESVERNSRIDVHFGSVRLMAVRNSYQGLKIRVGDPGEVAEIEDRYEINVGPAFLHVIGADLLDFVVSDPVLWHEGDDPDDYTVPGVFGEHLG